MSGATTTTLPTTLAMTALFAFWLAGGIGAIVGAAICSGKLESDARTFWIMAWLYFGGALALAAVQIGGSVIEMAQWVLKAAKS